MRQNKGKDGDGRRNLSEKKKKQNVTSDFGILKRFVQIVTVTAEGKRV